MAKIYSHAVIYKGVFYPANTPIVEESTEKPASAGSKKEPAAKAPKKAVKKNDNERTV